ncbi:Por secretion system C-terminal sorting domain-containing protein [Aquiflexum balticum DSM 16537]|uniref:Por secretion system C-terminal sorting domain-containing protein n=1 Tax=Aquiflexum balticum DSM 16537 TaxID=758820 RepID=A0A1W2H5Z9_9BACT|nr:T9SS type A sorting domain-containing protein [Aquiflexum balticum]SMD44355.1 Por secretion system C-terminal sorting domain-containing protein [Aquiflexum balticum DSM 16537]
MKKNSLFLYLFLAISHLSFSQTWTGNLSNNWNTPGNWTPATVPGPGSDVIIDNATAPNQPFLPSDITVRDLSVSAGVLNLNGFELNVRDLNLTGGSISNGTIETSRNILEMQNMVFDGNMTIIKNGGGNNDLTGGNVFNGPTIITNLNNSRLRLAATNGDTFNSTVVFNKNGVGSLEIAYNGTNTFEEEVTINNTVANNQLNIGQGGGTSTLSNGGLNTSDFNIGVLIINNLTQLNTLPNGVFNPTTLTISNSTFLGDFSATTTGVLTLAGSNTFASNNQFISGNQFAIPNGGNTFNSISGTTTITRNGGGAVIWGPGNSFGALTFTDNAPSNMTWEGNNTFNGNVLITNNSNNIFRIANTLGDVFGGTVHFINNGTSTMDIAFNGNTTFADQITIDNNGAGNIRFGGTAAQTGTSVQSSGGINTNDLTNGTLTIRRFTQLDNIANGPFNPLNFEVENSSFNGDFSITTIGQTTFTGGSSFGGNNSFTATGNIVMVIGGNTFSNPGNTTTMIRNGGGNVTWGGGNSTGNFILENNTPGNLVWQGGNTFNGDVIITNNSNNLLRLANTNGDEYLGTSVFINNGTNTLDIGRSGTNIYMDQITINNINAGGTIGFGLNGGTNELQNGALTTTNFTTGNLNIRNFDQLTNFANGPFEPNTFTVGNSSFEGDFTVTTSGDMNLQADVRFASNNNFTSNGQLTLGGNSEFSTNGGTNSYFEKNGGGNVNWNGGNTFGTVEFVKNAANYIRMTNNGMGDTFTSTSVFSNNNSGEFDIARNGTNTFGDQIEINNTNPSGSIRFGAGGGNSTQTNGSLITSGFNTGILTVQNFTQNQDIPNGPFLPITFTVGNSSFEGDFSVTTSGDMNLQADVRFASNNNFISNGQLTLGGNSEFSSNGGTNSYFEKNGGGNVNWNGGNTFGTVEFVKNAANYIRMTNNGIGDTFTSTSVFSNNNSGEFDIARNGSNTFASTVTINNSSTGGFYFGRNGGTSLLSVGSLQTTDFNSGFLEIRNFFQSTATPNGNFQPETFLSNNVSFQGNFSVSTSSTGGNSLTFQNNSRFARTNSFISAGAIVMTGGNRFSTAAGTTTTMIKNGGTDNDWQGGNIFGNFNLTNNGNGRIRLANSVGGDEFRGNVIFNQNGSGLLEPARNNTSTFLGNISTVGSASPIIFGAGNGVVEIVGNAVQQLLGDSFNEPRINRLTVNTTGTLDVLVPFTLGVNMTLNNGIVQNEENMITFLHNSSVTGGSNASHVDGRIRKIGNTAFTYPFGNGGFYAPLTTSSFGGGGSTAFHFTGRFFHINPDLVPYDRESKESSIGVVNECEYWEFERTNGSANPSVTLSWSDDRTCPIVDFAEFIVVQWNGSEWIDLGQAGLAGDETSGTVRNQTAVSNWSNDIFTLGQSFRILPIELLSFSATPISDRQIKVSWSTVSEKDNAFFTIMKSFDGQDWFPIGIVAGAGNSDLILNYEFIDENAVFGRQFYRLTQTDFDGTSETFKAVGVTLNEIQEKLAVKVYPNPTQGKVNILSENQNLENASISIYNAQGSLIISLPNQSGRIFEIDLSGLEKGIYLMKIYSNYQVETKKIILH